jgi:hypothetical protein
MASTRKRKISAKKLIAVRLRDTNNINKGILSSLNIEYKGRKIEL